jgi:hypothetical protein
MTLAYIEQRGGDPSKFIMDAKSWKPIKGNAGFFRACTETRWHPTKPTVMIGWNKTTLEIIVFDVITDYCIKRVKVGFASVGLMGEGSLSDDGSMVALGDTSNNVVLVDIEGGRVSAKQYVSFIRSPNHLLGNLTVSPLSTPSGGKVVVKASDTPELVHVYDYGSDLLLHHRFESDLTLSHGDVAVTPAGREVFVGGSRTWFGPVGGFNEKAGRVAAIDLDSGMITNISAGLLQLGSKEAADQHCSGRGPKGWVGVTYAGPHETAGQYCDELVLWKLDGSRECVRFGVNRTNDGTPPGGVDPYRSEAHGVWRPDGKAVMFASNWQHFASPAFSPPDIKDFVYEIMGPPPPVEAGRYYVNPDWQYSPVGAVFDRVSGRIVPLADVVAMMNKK